jgi:hypothetical protein
MFNSTHWSDRFGDGVSKIREAKTGEIGLVYVGEFNEDWLETLWREMVKPAEAARVLEALRANGHI